MNEMTNSEYDGHDFGGHVSSLIYAGALIQILFIEPDEKLEQHEGTST